MSDRVPETSLHRSLARYHGTVRSALVARHGLRGAASACIVVALAVIVGVALPLGPGAAWTRLILTMAGCGLAAAVAVGAFMRAAPRFDAWLEGLERHFPELRSWLRNGLDLEASA